MREAQDKGRMRGPRRKARVGYLRGKRQEFFSPAYWATYEGDAWRRRTPHPALRATFSRKGRRGQPTREQEIMTTHHRLIPPGATSRARMLRAQETDAERALWRLLRGRRLESIKWRRQFPIGAYVVDFVCFEHRLIVECDGFQHAGSQRDVARDAWLRAQGFTIARFWNHEILGERESVLNTILARCGLPG
jgi:very-short-patch-repair endonuclease